MLSSFRSVCAAKILYGLVHETRAESDNLPHPSSKLFQLTSSILNSSRLKPDIIQCMYSSFPEWLLCEGGQQIHSDSFQQFIMYLQLCCISSLLTVMQSTSCNGSTLVNNHRMSSAAHSSGLVRQSGSSSSILLCLSAILHGGNIHTLWSILCGTFLITMPSMCTCGSTADTTVMII